jgi:hypothetical protein
MLGRCVSSSEVLGKLLSSVRNKIEGFGIGLNLADEIKNVASLQSFS